jgi:hypothetical protein
VTTSSFPPLPIGNLLQKNLGALAICWQQALIAASGNAVAHRLTRSSTRRGSAVSPQRAPAGRQSEHRSRGVGKAGR